MAAVKAGQSIQTTLAAVVAHPTRVKCLSILAERTVSPVELAHELDADVGHVSYHVNKLRDLGVVELVSERQVRGAVEHHYRATTLAYVSDEEWAKLSPEQRQPYSLYTLQLVTADAGAAIESGSFDARNDRYLTRTPAALDEEGWSEMHALHEEMLERTMQVSAAAADRLAGQPGAESIPVMSIAMFFETAPRGTPSAVDAPPSRQ
jgi:DNA-binding transcriptional ArsR family regulator